MFCVYMIINEINGNIYIGKTKNFTKRWADHKADSVRGTKYRIYNSMRYYGLENFSIHKIEEFEFEKECLEAEVSLIEYYKSIGAILLNMTNGGDGMSGMKFTKETKVKMSLAKLGKTTKLKGIPRNDETKKKISLALIGRLNNDNIKKMKPVIITTPNNEIIECCSIASAAKKLNVSEACIKKIIFNKIKNSKKLTNYRIAFKII